jgi:hypothetical protein
MTVLRLVSFGYPHLPTDEQGRPIPPAVDRIDDGRDRLKDPAARDILDLNDGSPIRNRHCSSVAAR